MNLPSDVLFDAGRDSLKKAAKKSLDVVITEIKSSYPDKQIRLVGSTPIRSESRRTATRPTTISASSVPTPSGSTCRRWGLLKQISYESHGPNKPRSSKAESRRVELVVIVDE